jgi:hypothetical protein
MPSKMILILIKMKTLEVCYLKTVSGLYSISDKMINEYTIVGRFNIVRGDQSTWGKPGPEPLLSSTNLT